MSGVARLATVSAIVCSLTMPNASGLDVEDTFSLGGLVWQMSPSREGMNWDDAKDYCANIGWRLPTRTELLALYSDIKSSTAHSGMVKGIFWSATTWKDPQGNSRPDAAWVVLFPKGVASYHSKQTNPEFARHYGPRVRCVR
jgi:hypothetical protein